MLVGNGTSLLDKEYSNTINTYSIIVRFNSFKLNGYEITEISNDTSLRAIRLRMPIRNENPALNSLSEHSLSGAFYTSWVNFNFPDV